MNDLISTLQPHNAWFNRWISVVIATIFSCCTELQFDLSWELGSFSTCFVCLSGR
ncbi:hypothetical protein M8C21_021446, partial [Ambrosia artemisiifolia]